MAREASENREEVDSWERLERHARDLLELEQLVDADAELAGQVQEEQVALERELHQRELDLLFADPYANHNAVMSITVGQGGVDAQDWVEILLRMYARWASPSLHEVSTLRPGCEIELLDTSPGEEAGLKGATAIFRGRRAYGLLRSEHGVHRLVRISPFDQNHRRHTSFALVEVMPELDEAEEAAIEINPDDLRVDTYRSTGAGGQHVNKTDSAVRITHIPTGIVVQCQNERSQIKNREIAMKVLRARLFEVEMDKKKADSQAIEDSKMDIAFGSQIRSYVLQPYRLVKDTRTKAEVGDVDRVLDGDLEPFMKAYLQARAASLVR